MSSRKEFIVPVFIPHMGCPHLCVFCNQKNISGASHAPSPEEVLNYLDASLSPEKPVAVIAFYGGTFTAIPVSEQEKYLSIAQRFIAEKWASCIRLSTRPDEMDERVVRFLKEHGVRTVELGVQSLDDGVLKKSGRGHAAGDAVRAAGIVKDAGLELGIQLMAGLPGDSKEKFLKTVSGTVRLKPHFVRIYPALVVEGSGLADMWRRGEYRPLALDEAVELCAEALEIFDAAGIRVIKLGLQPGDELEKTLLAGPYHPSFGHLVKSNIALKKMLNALEGFEGDSPQFIVNERELSIYKGIGGENVRRIKAATGKDASITPGDAAPGTLKILP
jgi:histone acetyltransferase (RNA polymerase elongator complex component)